MRIMSFNLLCYGNGMRDWHFRRKLAVEVIKKTAPDSLGVQEAHQGWINALSAGLEEYAFVGVGREDGKCDGEYSAVFYLKDKYELVESDTFWLSETPDKPSKGWDGACTRICTWAKLKDKSSGKIYVHINTHLDHVGPVAQAEGAKLIRDKAASFNGIPVVCTGDFNVLEGSKCYDIVCSANLADSKKLAPDTMSCGTYHGFQPEKILDIIDFIFVDEKTVKPLKYEVLNYKIGDKFYSDHYAVCADLEI